MALRRLELDWLPAALAAYVLVVALGADQGGYFPTSWAPAVVASCALLILWLALGARTDAGWPEAALVSLLGLFAAWTALSTVWASAPTLSITETQRVLVLLSAVCVVLVVATRAGESHLAYAVMAGITTVGGYSLATRLAPGALDTFDPSSGYRLSGTIGYWNGLGTFTAMGIVLAVGIAADLRAPWQRISASVALVVLAPTLYFTFSRGATVALFVGLAAMFAATPRRIHTLGSLVLLLPAPAIAVVAASRSAGLTNETATRASASAAGHTMALVLVGLAILAAASGAALVLAEGRIDPLPSTRRIIAAAALLAVAIAFGAGVASVGGPGELRDRVASEFDSPPAAADRNLNDHLRTLSGSGRAALWRVAWATYEKHPGLGVGAGGFERYWLRDERATFAARDAHSLYLQTLTELGPVGLLILLGVWAVIVGGATAARRHPVVPCGLGAFVVYAVHAGVEWDWELTGVTLTGLLAGATGLVALRRGPSLQLGSRLRIVLGVAAVVVATASTLGYVGNKALASGQSALDGGDPARALADAQYAERWTPWSPFPPTVRGEALLRLGDVKGANAAFRDAIDTDPGYWRAWLGLAVASTGQKRQDALNHASSLYYWSSEIYRTVLLLRRSEQRIAK